MSSDPFHSQQYLGAFVLVTGVAVGLAVIAGDRDMAFAAAILGLYVLHLISVRTLVQGQRQQWEAVRELESLVGELDRAERAAPGTPAPEGAAREGEPVRRHFALGTVAIIRDVMEPAEISRILIEQRKRPERGFGELAVEMGLLSENELESLLRAQQEGQFTQEEIRTARQRLEDYHASKKEEISARAE